MRLNNVFRLVTAVTLAVVLGACSSKKKAEDQAGTAAPDTSAPTAPAIETTPMNFDVAGSDSGKITGLQTVNFDFDKSSLSADAKDKLKGNADWMKSNGKTNMQIEGHCDAKGSIEYNLALGERRAQAVRSYMIGLGITSNRLNIISYGKERPIAKGDSEADHSKNRRANFVPIAQ